MKKLAGAFNLMSLASRSLSRSSRTRASLQNVLKRLIGGVAAATALVFAAQTLDRPQVDPSVDTFHSISPVATSPVLRSVPSHRLTLESRSSARSANGFDAALPVAVRAALINDAPHQDAAVASVVASASIVARGYDATAPPR